MLELSKRGETTIDSLGGREEFLKQKNKKIIAVLAAGVSFLPLPLFCHWSLFSLTSALLYVLSSLPKPVMLVFILSKCIHSL